MGLLLPRPDQLPVRCALFLIDAFTGGPIEGVPVGLRATFSITTATSVLGTAIQPTSVRAPFVPRSAVTAAITAQAATNNIHFVPPSPPAPIPPSLPPGSTSDAPPAPPPAPSTAPPGGGAGTQVTSGAPQREQLLGILATDHAGYASWDLAPLIRRLE